MPDVGTGPQEEFADDLEGVQGVPGDDGAPHSQERRSTGVYMYLSEHVHVCIHVCIYVC